MAVARARRPLGRPKTFYSTTQGCVSLSLGEVAAEIITFAVIEFKKSGHGPTLPPAGTLNSPNIDVDLPERQRLASPVSVCL